MCIQRHRAEAIDGKAHLRFDAAQQVLRRLNTGRGVLRVHDECIARSLRFKKRADDKFA